MMKTSANILSPAVENPIIQIRRGDLDVSIVTEAIKTYDARVIAEALGNNTRLDLGRTQIEDDETHALAEALRSNRTLKALCLKNNHITDEGSKTLAEALTSNRTLTRLDLNNNLISNAGTKAIAKALRSNRALTRLDLKHNLISDKGAAALLAALKNNTTLKALDLGGNNISESILEKINAQLEENNKIAARIKEPASRHEIIERLTNIAIRTSEHSNNIAPQSHKIRELERRQQLSNGYVIS